MSDPINTGPQDLAAVHKAVVDIQASWKCFGTQLGLEQVKVDTADVKCHSNPKECLREVLCEWLNGNYNKKKHGNQSWRKVCEATASPAGGGNTELANRIAKQYQKKLRIGK